MDEEILVAYLFGVGNNSATVGIGGSTCDRMWNADQSVDIRTPSFLVATAMNRMLEGLDRGLPPVTNWPQLYSWLGRSHGWAYFTRSSSQDLLPHWFSGVEYRCQQVLANGVRLGPFIDLEAFPTGSVSLDTAGEMFGPDAEQHGETERILAQLSDNFIVTQRPIFVV